MMRGIRRLVVCTVVSGLLAAGAIGATIQVAHADGQVAQCIGAADSTPTAYSCVLQAQFSDAASITISVVDNGTKSDGTTAAMDVTVNVTTLTCTDNSATDSAQPSGMTTSTPVTDDIAPLPATAVDGQCNVEATVSAPATGQPSGDVQNPFTATLNYTSSADASPSPTATSTSSASSAVHPVKGYDGKCLDDNGNSSANRAKIQIWSCSGSDQAENWSFSSGELKHNGKCLNDQGNAGNRGKVILYSCNGGSNEKWSELANGELKLSAHNGAYCLDDPGSSTKNGTQLIIYSCKDSANQKWALP
jgi:Ricin-type beta-trefoil lectin domain